MATNALANAPKSIRDQAAALARSASAKTKRAIKSAQKVEAPIAAVAGGTLLGLAERMLPDVQLGPIDNGVTVGLPLTIAGAFAPGKLGEWMMGAGAGMLASGGRTMARTLGAEAETGFAPGEVENL